MKNSKQSNSGFTLTEVLITLLVLSIVLAFGVPNFREQLERRQIIGLAEQVAYHVMQARQEAIARSNDTFINIATGNNWAYGISMETNCNLTITNPAQANACVLVVEDGDAASDPGDGSVDVDDLVLSRFNVADFPGTSIAIANFSSGNTQIRFDPVRGTSNSGDITVASTPSNFQLRIRVGLLGDVRICSPNGDLPFSTTNC